MIHVDDLTRVHKYELLPSSISLKMCVINILGMRERVHVLSSKKDCSLGLRIYLPDLTPAGKNTPHRARLTRNICSQEIIDCMYIISNSFTAKQKRWTPHLAQPINYIILFNDVLL